MIKRPPSANNHSSTTKVVNIPLLFKNCSIEVTTPSRKTIQYRTNRGASSTSKGTKINEKSSSKKSTPRGWGATPVKSTESRCQTLKGKKIVKIDLKRHNSKQKIEQPKPKKLQQSQERNQGCKSHSRMKTSLPTKASLPTQPSEATCLTERTFTEQTLTQTQQMPTDGPVRVASSRNIGMKDPQQISTEMSCETLSQTKISELHELRQRFIKKRSEVYQVLCNLDTKFEKLDKEIKLPPALRQVDTNAKKQIVNLLKQRTSPRSPALFAAGGNHPINSVILGKRTQEGGKKQ